MKVVTAAEMQRLDRLTTERWGVPSLSLMENAGRAVVEFLEERCGPLNARKITILCGRGNNGGDGLVVARLLREKKLEPRVVLFSEPENVKGDAAENLKRLAASGAPDVAVDAAAWERVRSQLAGTTLFVDALLGTGLAKPLEGFLLGVVRDINSVFPSATVVAVDLPTGISADTGDLIGPSVRADATVTFTAPKMAHVFPPACEQVGEWVVRPIGTPQDALEQDPTLSLNLTSGPDVSWIAQRRKTAAHKGNFGHVLLLAGSVGKTGAAALAAKSALRAGAGLVTVATAKSALPIIASLGMEFMTEPLPESDSGTVSLRALDYGRLDKLVEGKTVLAVGPGIGTVPETSELVRTVVNRYNLPVVIDADGLNAFAGSMSSFRNGREYRYPAVLTPHPGEMARLVGQKTADIQKNRLGVARNFARQYKLYLVLKGYRTLSAAPDGQVWVNPTGNPGMATGGTGDVLTGILAGLLAQHAERPTIEVIASAVYLHGLAGDLASQKVGETSMIAGDLMEALPEAFARIAAGHSR
jgi:ADP-dependent NAD(P)H-hydrate dehydratase / NAD(P)H-hydrate epimerase